MKIIEYSDKYASEVADMWNQSNSSWGNEESLQTKEDVINSEASSGNIKLYLALDNDEVVGYCSFSEYKNDEGASYLPLLNVRPDYHGKKVGKTLILKVLEDAIKSEWPRFDLYTWSGNIKAMPLYKKCGFFWERKNDTVHLMNFIPYLHQTEALKSILKDINWYQDSIRHIDMKQDGIKDNGFEYYRYEFKNDKTSLRVEFERTGRGIRMIETPDYFIEMSLEGDTQVFNDTYQVSYKVINKSNNPLELQVQGVNNKNISYNEYSSHTVTKETTIVHNYFVGEIKVDQDKGKTYPVVEATITVNSKKAQFKIGLEPKFPVKLKLNVTEYNHILGKEYKGYLDIENNLQTKEMFKINLPDTFVSFTKELSVELDAKEKHSIPVTYTLNDYGFYKEIGQATYGEKAISCSIESLFKSSHSSFSYLSDGDAYIISGNYTFTFKHHGNNTAFNNELNIPNITSFFVPQLGLPYSLEFNNIKPEITFISNNDIDIKFTSKAFKDVELIIHASNNYGVLTLQYEVLNKGCKRELALNIPMWQDLKDSLIPYGGEILEVLRTDGSGVSNLYSNRVDENWIYNKTRKYGITWDKKETMTVSDWKVGFSKTGISLEENETYKSGKFYCSFTHNSVEDFRAFAGHNKPRKTINYLNIKVNKGNPFTTDKVQIEVDNKRKISLKGQLEVDDIKSDIKDPIITIPGLKNINLNLSDRYVKFDRLTHRISGKIDEKYNQGVYEVNNGEITFKSSEKYASSLYSLNFNNEEWLDSNYPKPKERAWWGNFIGGISFLPSGMQDGAALQEKRETRFVKIKDNYNNEWSGIKTILSIDNDPALKGLVLENYYLTLPGVKLVHTFTNVINKTGKLILRKTFERSIALHIDDVKKAVTFAIDNTTYKCNDLGVDNYFDKLITFKGNRDYDLAIYNKDNKMLVETQKEFLIVWSEQNLTIPQNSAKQLVGDFLFFTKDHITKDTVKDFENIKFEV